MNSIPGQFLEIAEAVGKRSPPQTIEKLLSKLCQECESAARQFTTKEAQAAFIQVQQALETWKSVWPKLGSQPEFRSAVVREARAWSNRLKNFHPECGT